MTKSTSASDDMYGTLQGKQSHHGNNICTKCNYKNYDVAERFDDLVFNNFMNNVIMKMYDKSHKSQKSEISSKSKSPHSHTHTN